MSISKNCRASWAIAGLSAKASSTIRSAFFFNSGRYFATASAGGAILTSLPTLSAGTHTITASVTDSGGRPGSDQVTLTITPNDAPWVLITAPPDGSTVDEGLPVAFSGTASDTEDGDLSASLAWSSDLDGALGSGASFELSTLSVGVHTITTSVTDSGGRPGSDQITLTITANDAPVVAITAPPDASSVSEAVPVSFSATATDTEDGDLSASLAWSSDLDGALGSGASLELSTLSRKELEKLQQWGYLKMFLVNFRIIGLLAFGFTLRRQVFAFLKNHLRKK